MFFHCHLYRDFQKSPAQVGLTNIKNKCVIRKINLYFYDFMKNGEIFLAKVCPFTDSFLGII